MSANRTTPPAAQLALKDLPATSPTSHQTPRTIESAELFGGQSLVLIRHLGEIYRLQTTRQGKLILTK